MWFLGKWFCKNRFFDPGTPKIAMKKAYFFLPTLLIGLSSWSLPKLNTHCLPAGKFIKAARISHFETTALPPGDSISLPAAPMLRKGSYEIKTVVIDPGHGGHDPGCLGARSKEKNHCLAIGKYLAEALRQNYPGLNVIMTRSTDVFIPLNERAAIATRNKADLFISIHCNYIPKAGHVHGTETYVLGLHATKENLEVAKRENAAILLEDNYEETYGYDPNSPEAHILLSMFQNAFLEQSISFAEKVQTQASTHSTRKDRGVKQAGFLVLRYATMPSVLVETGYLSNGEEEDYLRSEEGQRSMANSLLMAFAEYKAEMEGKEPQTIATLDEAKQAVSRPAEPTSTKEEQLVASAVQEDAKAVPVKVEAPPTAQPPAKQENQDRKTAVKTEGIKMNEPPSPAPIKPLGESKESTKATEPPGNKPKILASTPVLTEPMAPAPQNTEVQFRVQLAASPQLLDVTEGRWMKVPFLIEVVEENKLFKYQVRSFASLDEANDMREKLRQIGFNDAFVVAYLNGKRVDPKKYAN